VTPPQLTSAFRQARAVIDDQPAMSTQPALAAFFQSGLLAAHVRRMRKRYAHRQQLLLDAAARHLGGLIELKPDEAGLHLVGQLIGKLTSESDEAIADRLYKAGLVTPPLSRYDIGDDRRRGLMFGYAAVPDGRIEPAIREIGRLLRK
jgi:GntR family transcriptional regulator/MocR family aminotransferase